MQLKTYISKEKFTRLAGDYQAKTGLPLILVDPDGKIAARRQEVRFLPEICFRRQNPTSSGLPGDPGEGGPGVLSLG